VQVTILPNQRRPEMGKFPARENRRAWLPQQARFCPVLEDGSRLGFLVYPPLDDRETCQIRYMPNSTYRFSMFVNDDNGVSHQAFVVDLQPAAGGGGADLQEVVFLEPSADIDESTALGLVDALTTNVNGSPGGVGLRGAHDFVTPEGWDTIYTGVLNEQQRPNIPVLTARIETDWYPQPTEFRYALQPGDVISTAGSVPIGQVLFVPREPIELVAGGEQDQERFSGAQREYWEERHTKEQSTNFGAVHSYHYRDVQKERRTASEERRT
jgi:hypothetical protein